MRSGGVVVGDTGGDDLPRVIEIEKQALVEKLFLNSTLQVRWLAMAFIL
jgi:hypothetical protein